MPEGSDAVLIAGLPAGAILIENPVVEEAAFASSTFAVNEYAPAVLGVPAIAPLEAFSCRPVGSVPALVLQVYGGVPPAALRLEE